MAVTLTNPLGRVQIADEVLSAIAGHAARECYGIVGVIARSVPDGIAELLGLENIHRGVQVRAVDGQLHVNLFVVVEYGVNIFQVARNAMAQVKHRLEQLSGLPVERVDVHVQGVRVSGPGRRPAHAARRG